MFQLKGFRSILDAMKSYAEENNQKVPDIEASSFKEFKDAIWPVLCQNCL